MLEKFTIEIISPDRTIIKTETSEVVIPSFEGEMTILADHIPLITFLRPGITKVEGSKQSQFFVEEGTVEFSNNTLIILSSTITSLESIKNQNINKIIEESKSKLTQDNLSDKARYIVSHKIDTLLKINQ